MGQTRCRGLRVAAAYLRGLCALWPQGRIEGSKYVEQDIHFRTVRRRSSGVSPLLDARCSGLYGCGCIGTHLGLGVATLVLS